MTWHVEFNSEWDCIHTVYTGPTTIQDVNEATEAATALTHPNRPSRFLSEVRDSEIRISTMDLYNMPNGWKFLGANKANKLAIVATTQQQANLSFLEDTSRNRGWQVALFSSRQPALDWLSK